MTDHDKLREAILSLRDGVNHTSTEWRDLTKMVCDAAESTLPRTKMVEVWHVEFAGAAMGNPYIQLEHSESEARQLADQRHREGATCIRVTGPHQQEVPA